MPAKPRGKVYQGPFGIDLPILLNRTVRDLAGYLDTLVDALEDREISEPQFSGSLLLAIYGHAEVTGLSVDEIVAALPRHQAKMYLEIITDFPVAEEVYP